MPCQFIASCFFLENPWGKGDTTGNLSAKAAVEAQAVIVNQEPQPLGPEYHAEIAPPPDAAVNVEQQPKAGGEVATSPNGTPDRASSKARTAKTFRAYLPSQCHRTYSCVHCRYSVVKSQSGCSGSFPIKQRSKRVRILFY